ncbi:MAG: hypothetical protein WDO24_19320 [Pseudomonadota bacterium]
MPPELAQLHKPHGHWIALPLQVYRTNTLFISKKAMDKVGATKLPVSWAEFEALGKAMKVAGITPIANGGIRWGRRHEVRDRARRRQPRRLSRGDHGARRESVCAGPRS